MNFNEQDFYKRRQLAKQIYFKTQKIKRNKNLSFNCAISFDELKVPYQYYLIMDMHAHNMLALAITNNRKLGIVLKSPFIHMNFAEFMKAYDRNFSRFSYGIYHRW